jgi:WD40 repeat protein
MDHTNIARVLDAGATDSGRPYFVMELVRGIPITQFCDDNRLALPKRLELFVMVCQAVQHAHQKGIIHRDLKPSNVLVTLNGGTPLVKVIDFGIAKALGQQRLTEKTLCTGFAQMIGTPLYMSPEQAERSGQDADTRTDIYALGVLLYELLTGTTPFDRDRLKEASYDEIRRIIREEEPAKPSTRISTLGQAAATVSVNRKSEPKRLSHLFRGELDWIVMKALEKDRNRRYETASSFAADVQGYLDDEPVQACPPSAVYRFRKFARRHKAALTTASAVVLAVLLTVAVSSVWIWRANRELRQNLYYQHIALAEREWSANNLSRVEQLLDACPTDLRGWEWRYLKRLRYGALPPLRHDEMALCVLFSPDGQRIACCAQGGVIKIWEARTGREVRQISTHEAYIPDLAFSPDGRYLASASSNRAVKIWDPQTGEQLGTLGEQVGPSSSVAFSPDSQLLACAFGSGQQGATVKIWELSTGREVLALSSPKEVCRVQFSPDRRRIATADVGGTVKLWDAQTGEEQRTILGPTQWITGLAFSPDGRVLAAVAGNISGYPDQNVNVWDAATGQRLLSLSGYVGSLGAVAFSPDGRRLASAGIDQTIKLWDLATGRETLALRGHLDNILSLAFSPDGTQLASASADHTVRVWDATPVEGETGLESLTLRGHRGAVISVAFHPIDARRLASGSADGTVFVWDTLTGHAIHTLPGHGARRVAFDPNGGRLGTIRADKTIEILDVATAKEVCTFSDPNDGGILSLAFAPDGRHIASAGWDWSARVWDLSTRRKIEIRDHTAPIHAVKFSPDGRYIATGCADSCVRLCDATTGQVLRILEPKHAARVEGLAFSRDGRFLASASWDRTVKVWDAKTWKLVHNLPDPTGGVQCVAFSPDGRLLAWGSTDATVKVWDAATKEIIQTLRGHTSWVEDVAFSPDGKWIASASADGTVKIWNVAPPPRQLK